MRRNKDKMKGEQRSIIKDWSDAIGCKDVSTLSSLDMRESSSGMVSHAMRLRVTRDCDWNNARTSSGLMVTPINERWTRRSSKAVEMETGGKSSFLKWVWISR